MFYLNSVFEKLDKLMANARWYNLPTEYAKKGILWVFESANGPVAWFSAQWENLIFAVGIVAIAAIVAFVAKHVVKFAGKVLFSGLTGRVIEALAAPGAWIIVLVGLSLGNNAVVLPDTLNAICRKVFYALLIIVTVWGLTSCLLLILKHDMDSAYGMDSVDAKSEKYPEFAGRRRDGELGPVNIASLLQLVKFIVRFSLPIVPIVVSWVAAILFIAKSLFSINVTALIIGFGITVLAVVVLALKGIADFFNVFSINIFISCFIDICGKRIGSRRPVRHPSKAATGKRRTSSSLEPENIKEGTSASKKHGSIPTPVGKHHRQGEGR